MPRYIMAHWRGTESLGKSFLINGVVLYVVFVGLLVSLGNYINVRVGLALFLVYMTWVLVGIFRCGLRIAFYDLSAWWRRAQGIGAIIVSVIGGIASINDLRNLLL